MTEAAADIRADQLALHLGSQRFGRSYEAVAACGSTNDLAALRAREGAAEGLVVLADQQSSGRGQKGRRWVSSAGQNLTFSLLLRPPCPITALPPLTLLAGVAVARTLRALGIAPRLKWPNDVLVDQPAGPRKLVGILTEMATVGDRIKHVVVGIGLNVNQTRFDDEVAATATSLALLLGRPVDRAPLLAQLLGALEAVHDQALGANGQRGGEAVEAALAAWRDFAQLPRPCRVERPQGPLEGTAVDVDRDGALLVRDHSGGVQRVLSGEISPG
jgi:BirA family transcriptional regulator, biotin operon repressor / biotin---[acetyl-CoA-carboxylase] ligase